MALLRLVALSIGIVLATLYYGYSSQRFGVLDRAVNLIAELAVRWGTSNFDTNEKLLNDAEALIGGEIPTGNLRVLFLSVPEEARWGVNSAGTNDQILTFGNTIPDFSLRQVWFPSSFKLSESYGAFLYAIDPEKSNNNPEWVAYRSAQTALLTELRPLFETNAGKLQTEVAGQSKVRRTIKSSRLKGTDFPGISKDLADARTAFENDGNWISDGVPKFTLVGNLAEWKSEGVQSQTLLFRGQATDIVVNEGADTHVQVSSDKPQILSKEVQLSVGRYKVFGLEAGAWFNRSILRKYGVGQYWSDGTPFWSSTSFFDASGMISLLPRGIIVAQRPTTQLRLAPDDFAKVVAGLKRPADISIGGVRLLPGQAVSLDESNGIVSISGGDSRAYVIGIVVEVLP